MPEALPSPKKSALGNLLRSPRLALVILSLTLLYTSAVSWLPWLAGASSVPPPWALRLGLDHPFRSLPFLAACSLLFVNTFACTCDRFGRVRRLWRGELPGYAAELRAGSGADCRELLLREGFKDHGGVYFKNRFALWGGFVLHVGILAIILSVAIQQAYSEGGSFEITRQEMVNLDGPGVVLGREAGYLAPGRPPHIQIALDRFDANLHQSGYASDRLSRLVVLDPAHPGRETAGVIDRSHGLSVGDTTIYQAIPTGYSLNIVVPQVGVRSIHLRPHGATLAEARVTDPVGVATRFILEGEQPLAGPQDPGKLLVRVERRGNSKYLEQGEAFSFGMGEARVVAISRWGGYTYARTPGIGLVFGGFATALAGCFLLLFPSGAARLPAGDDVSTARVYLSRGIDLLVMDWQGSQAGAASKKSSGDSTSCNL